MAMDLVNLIRCLIMVEVFSFFIVVSFFHSTHAKRKNNVKSSGADGCHLQTLNTCLCEQDWNGHFKADCSRAGLVEIPDLYPSNVIQLDLSFNDINVMRNSTFKDVSGIYLGTLKILSLSNNNISAIETGAFKGLVELETLLLYNNSLYAAFLRDPFMFAPFSSALRVLDVRRNVKDDCLNCNQYPGALLKTLPELTELYMDAIDRCPIGEDFKHLTRLRKLVFSGGRGKVVHITNNMFRYVPNITELDMAGIDVGFMSGWALKYLRNLKVLNLCNNPSLRKATISIVNGLRRIALEELYMNNTGIGDNMQYIIYPSRDEERKSMRIWTLDSNSIYDFGRSFVSKRYPNIEVLSLGDNYFSPGSRFFADFYDMSHLVGLNLSRQQGANYGFRKKRDFHQNRLHFCQLGTACPLNIPRQLQWVDMSYFGFQLPQVPELAILTNNSLNYINAAYTGVSALPFKIFCPESMNIVPQFKTFDLTGNSIRCINSSIFVNCSMEKLEYLRLGKNALGSVGPNVCHNGPKGNLAFLKPLYNLKTLDLRENNLGGKIPEDVFLNTTKLRNIDLSGNDIGNFNLAIDHLFDLELLDLSRNDLRCLDEKTYTAPEHIQRNKQDQSRVRIDLSDNPLVCNCSCLPFYNWLARMEVEIVDMATYQCKFPDGSTMNLRRLNTIVAKLESQCYNTGLLLIWLLTALTNIAVAMATITYR